MKVIVSIGNSLKGDDNIGNLILHRLKKPKDTVFFEGKTNPENLIGKIREEKPDTIIFIDAIEFGEKPGTVKMFSLRDIQNLFSTTHNIPLIMIEKFFPGTEIKVIGIQPKMLEFGMDLTRELREKLPKIIEQVQKLIST